MIRICTILILFLLTSQADAMVLKIATLSPDGSSWMIKMRDGAKEVAQKTGNRVRIKYYPGGVMGDDKAVLRKIRIGQLHGGVVVANSLVKYFSDNQIYSLPFKFKSFKEVDYVRERMDWLIVDGLEKGGFVTFGLAEGGFAYVMSHVPIRSVNDVRRQKVWVPDNDPVILETVKVFGITPIPLSIADVRTGLQTGLINTVTTSPIGAIVLQWHTQVNYLMDAPFLYLYGVFAVDRKAFSKISPEDQSIVRKIMGRVFQEIDHKNRKDNIMAMETLQKQGIQLVKPSAEELNEWYTIASTLPKRLIKTGKISQYMLDTLESNLRDYRSKKSNAEE